jgi:predicted membrane-bound spermidine synthase
MTSNNTLQGWGSNASRWLVSLFFVSGFTALLYQVAWQRMLGLFAGSDVRSATIVVSAYLAGLAIGSMIGTFYSDRLSSRRAVQLYGGSSLGIAVFAFLSKLLFYNVLFSQGSAFAISPGILMLVAFVSLLWPTMLMGLTLPLTSRAIVRSIETAPAMISRLNGINILGAAFGALISGFVLVGNLGYDRTVYLGGALNTLVGLAALLLASRFEAESPALRAEPGSIRPISLRAVPPAVWTWCGLFLVSGFMAISLEIIWLRVLGSMTQATPYLFATILFCFLAADGAGSLLGARWARRSEDSRRVFMLLQAILALYALLSIWGTAALPSGGAPGLLRTLAPLVIVFIPALAIGLAFPFVQKAIQTDLSLIGQRVSLIQTANIVGNVGAGLMTGLVLLHFLGSATALRSGC